MNFFALSRPCLFMVKPETAHQLTITALKCLPIRQTIAFDAMLSCEIAGIKFPSPFGLAAGFDKNAEVPAAMLALGFGFVEVGTLTPLPQDGNPRPRLFRLVADQAIINRLGFNNGGQAAAHARLVKMRGGVVGVNIGANKDSTDRIADYAKGVRAMADVATYLTVNISSPNTPGLRALQDKGALTDLLDAVSEARGASGPPIFLKLAPDLETADIDNIVDATAGRVDALIIANTTISRPPLLSPDAGQSGGLSGAPLAPLAAARLRDFRVATGGRMPLIAAGGIDSAEAAYARVRSGASLVQLYSALVYHGPGLARTMASGLAVLLKRDGFASLSEAIGVDVR
jgi:dihydroorotate dehydrogenase